MKYINQMVIILAITFAGEVLRRFLPFPIPASIYGLLILLTCLITKIIKLEQVSVAGHFLVELMPLMFIPASVGLIAIYKEISHVMIPIIFITLSTTVITMAVTGKVTDFILRKDEK